MPFDPNMSLLEAPQLLSSGAIKGELDISQRDPLWLKERGDKFYLRRDWRAAEHAYGLVLAQFSTNPNPNPRPSPHPHPHLYPHPPPILSPSPNPNPNPNQVLAQFSTSIMAQAIDCVL